MTRGAASVLALAVLLRLHGLGSGLPLEGEYYQFLTALHPSGLRPFFEFLLASPPLHVVLDPLCAFLVGRVSDSLFWLRLPAALAGAGAVAALAAFAARGHDRRLPLVAALLLAVSPLHVEWSRRADFYALLSLLSIVGGVLLLGLAARPRRWAGYAAWATVFLYAHPYAFPCAFLHAAFLLTLEPSKRSAALRAWGFAWAAAALLFSPWFLASTSALLRPEAFGFSYTWDAALPGPAACAAAAMLAACWAVSAARVGRGQGGPALRLAHLMAPAGAAAVLALDAWFHYYLDPRQFLWILPFFFVAAADGALAVWDARPAWRGAFAAAAALVCLAGVAACLDAAASQRRALRGLEAVSDALGRELRPGDGLVFQYREQAEHFLFHFDRETFAKADGFALASGHVVYRMDDAFPLSARRGGARARVLGVVPADAGAAAGPRDWLFIGGLEDLRVLPPAGRSLPGSDIVDTPQAKL